MNHRKHQVRDQKTREEVRAQLEEGQKPPGGSEDPDWTLTVLWKAGGEQVGVGAAALLREVDGHPDVLHPALHLCCTAAHRNRVSACEGLSSDGEPSRLPGGDHQRLPLSEQGEGVRDPPLILAFSDLKQTWRIQRVCRIMGMLEETCRSCCRTVMP